MEARTRHFVIYADEKPEELQAFAGRLERFDQVRDLVMADEGISEQRQLLIGSYFVCEYSLESAALFNPSIVPHPD